MLTNRIIFGSFEVKFVQCNNDGKHGQGTSKEAAIGPDAIISALMIDFIRRPDEWPKNPAYDGVSSPYLAQIASFFLGCGLAFLGTVQLGWLVNFISSSGQLQAMNHNELVIEQ